MEFAKVSKRENRVYVGNLSYDVKYRDLMEFMRGGGWGNSSPISCCCFWFSSTLLASALVLGGCDWRVWKWSGAEHELRAFIHLAIPDDSLHGAVFDGDRAVTRLESIGKQSRLRGLFGCLRFLRFHGPDFARWSSLRLCGWF